MDVFASVTDQHQKDGIIFTRDSQLSVVIAVVASGMVIDCELHQ